MPLSEKICSPKCEANILGKSEEDCKVKKISLYSIHNIRIDIFIRDIEG